MKASTRKWIGFRLNGCGSLWPKHAVADIVQAITFCKLAKQHRHKMRPCIIALTVMVGLILFNQIVRRISTHFL
jgi:hypothetical protein